MHKDCKEMNAIERKDWHKREHDVLIEKDSLDWKRAEKYKEQHSPYNKDNIMSSLGN